MEDVEESLRRRIVWKRLADSNVDVPRSSLWGRSMDQGSCQNNLDSVFEPPLPARLLVYGERQVVSAGQLVLPRRRCASKHDLREWSSLNVSSWTAKWHVNGSASGSVLCELTAAQLSFLTWRGSVDDVAG